MRSGQRRRARLWRQRHAVALVLALLAAGASAQTPERPAPPTTAPDSAAAPEAQRPVTEIAPEARDSSLVAPARPLAGRPATPVPAVTFALDAADLFREAGFAYDLGTPGRTAGLALDGIAPARLTLSLDGRPLADLATGAPRLDVLPWEAADRLALADARGGSVVSVLAGLRPFRLGVPVTELRYLPGESGLQVVSGTHAQMRRSLFGLGGPRARMTTTAHFAGRQANGPVLGARLRHAHAIARLAIAAPRWGAELAEHYTERTEGARRGVAIDANLYDPLRASVLDPSAERRLLRNEVALSARVPLAGSRPLAVWTSWTRQTARYTPGSGADTLSVSGNRYAAGATQWIGVLGSTLNAWTALEDDPWGRFDPLGDGNARLQAHAALMDTLSLGGVRLALQTGVQWVSGESSGFDPAVALRAERGGFHAAFSYAAAVPGRIEQTGFAPALSGEAFAIGPGVGVGAAPDGRERTMHAEFGARGSLGAFSFRTRALGQIVTDAARLVVLEDVSTAAADEAAFGYDRAAGALTHLGTRGQLGWREEASGGLYGTLSLALSTWGGDNPLARRVGEATPSVYGTGRLGYRATRVGTGTAALDLGIVARGWSAFRGVRVHPATGLLALANEDAARLPARPVLDLDASVTFSRRATVMIRLDNVLAGVLYDGAALVQGEPLATSQLRFGVFWALTE
ncbi:TonB-dependent receptor [Rubricoccus marinus]|uniref:TonB-dependent receptor-like beta-barrel domain-containing protein n=1 Tax=Rubricoccus marinus TaxID=716817 RepID=A0A259TUV4_9BACT|nr:TonB-dependent receptor [Rubricoccus marinus]OZC01523.1 hypothetical protein BSZ36_00090 [Rubricoccus marinus]